MRAPHVRRMTKIFLFYDFVKIARIGSDCAGSSNYINCFFLNPNDLHLMQESASPSSTAARKKTPTVSKSARKVAPTKSAAGKAASKAGSTRTVKAKTVVKPVKPKKPKMVRDSFTIPKDEYAALAELKQRCAKLAQPCKKSELLRAGIKALTAMSDKTLLAALKAIPAIKTGRPKKA